MDHEAPVIEVRDLKIRYGQVPAIHGISLAVTTGETVALIGANGAGKSTTLRGIAGLLPAAGGSIWFRGSEVTDRPAHARAAAGICLVPEGRGLFADQTVEDNLLLGTYRRRRPAAELSRDLEAIYARFPILAERRTQLAGTLSGGEQQILAIGRALMARPEVLLLDEPSLGLAPRLVEQIFRIIQDLREEGVPILLVEQMAYLALQRADRAFLMAQGRIVLEGKGADLLQDPNLVGAYLGQRRT
ncbi:MAG: ABC transporter ATP-binding protein [Candidatus Methylomirabilales bacterium]